jgi:hypothetical protein
VPSPAKPRASATTTQQLAAFGRRVAEQWPDVIRRCEHTLDGDLVYLDAPGTPFAGLRPLNDAIEIAAAFGAVPPGRNRDVLVAFLQDCQDEQDGMPRDPFYEPPPARHPPPLPDQHNAYMVLSVGYALACLGARFTRPLAAVNALSADDVPARLDVLPWRDNAWGAGAWVDALGTALWFNRAWFGIAGPIAPLIDALRERCSPHTGVWGAGHCGAGMAAAGQWLLPVDPWDVCAARAPSAISGGRDRHGARARENERRFHALQHRGVQRAGHRASAVVSQAARPTIAAPKRWPSSRRRFPRSSAAGAMAKASASRRTSYRACREPKCGSPRCISPPMRSALPASCRTGRAACTRSRRSNPTQCASHEILCGNRASSSGRGMGGFTLTARTILTLSCTDRPGIVGSVGTFLADHGCNIVESAQFGDVDSGRFFMRVVFETLAAAGLSTRSSARSRCPQGALEWRGSFTTPARSHAC